MAEDLKTLEKGVVNVYRYAIYDLRIIPL